MATLKVALLARLLTATSSSDAFLGFVSGSTHKIEVGNLTPTSSGYYVRFDGGKIYVIAQSGIDALLNLLTSPPFPATATPVATPVPINTPTPSAASLSP